MIYKRGGCNKKGPNGTCSKCDLNKKGRKRGSSGVLWYKFMWNDEMICESTRQKNEVVARNVESAYRTRLANEDKVRKKRQYSWAVPPRTNHSRKAPSFM